MMNIQFTGIAASLRAKQARMEAEERIAKFEQENELLMAQLVPVEEDIVVEEITQEDVEFELMMINDFRNVEIDICEDEAAWINNNVDLTSLLGTEEDTVTALSKKLNLSTTKVKLLVRKCLGYKVGSTYQQTQREYVRELIIDFRHSLYSDLEKQLRKARLYDFYRALLDYIQNRISIKPQSANEDELAFYIQYTELRSVCKEFGIFKGLDNSQLRRKLEQLCELGLLKNLQDEEMTEEALENANQVKTIASDMILKSSGAKIELKRSNYYVLNDLSPQVQDEAMARIKLTTESGLRAKDKNSTSLALVYGEDTQKTIMAQGNANINETKLRNFNEAAQILLEKQGYFTEEQLRKQYLKKDKNTKAKESYELTRTYLAATVINTNCIKTRVNTETRKKYSIPSKIKSNSYIFISR